MQLSLSELLRDSPVMYVNVVERGGGGMLNFGSCGLLSTDARRNCLHRFHPADARFRSQGKRESKSPRLQSFFGESSNRYHPFHRWSEDSKLQSAEATYGDSLAQYGPDVSVQLISALTRVFSAYLRDCG